MIWTYRCLIIEDSQVEMARTLTATIAGPSGANMLTTPLSPTGELPATHWISAGLIAENFAAILPLMTYPADAEPIYTPGQASLAAYLATKAGFAATEEDVQALFDVSDVTEQDAFTAMARLGLMMAIEPMEQFT